MRPSFNLAKSTVSISKIVVHTYSNSNIIYSYKALYLDRAAVTSWPAARQRLAFSSNNRLACSLQWKKLSSPVTWRSNGLRSWKRSPVPTTSTPSVPFKQITCLRSTSIWTTVGGKRQWSCQTVALKSTLQIQHFTTQSSALRVAKLTAPLMIKSSSLDQMRTSVAWIRVTCS